MDASKTELSSLTSSVPELSDEMIRTAEENHRAPGVGQAEETFLTWREHWCVYLPKLGQQTEKQEGELMDPVLL